MWSPHELLAATARALRTEATRLDTEQAVYGLDSYPELALHPLLATGLESGGFRVVREHPYPGEVQRRSKLPERERCDLVVLPAGSRHLLDPVRELKQKDKAAGTLFESLSPGPEDAADPRDAYWIEVKAVGQSTYSQGVPGPNRTYSSELISALTTDLRKLGSEAYVRFGGILLVLFTLDREVADHDLTVALHRAIDRGLSLRSPIIERFEVNDRIGNTLCTLALIEVPARDVS